MNDNYLINIEGTMEQEGDMDTVRLMTRGSFLHSGGCFFISYKETEATGYEGSTTTVTVENAHKVSMTRTGSAPSELVIERGKRHVCHYDHGYGVLSLGVAADEIENELGEHGGNLSFSYTLDSGNAHLSRNHVKITVQEAN